MGLILAAWVLVGGIESCTGIIMAMFYDDKYCMRLRLLGVTGMFIASFIALILKLKFPQLM